jgi:hypothetical protein
MFAEYQCKARTANTDRAPCEQFRVLHICSDDTRVNVTLRTDNKSTGISKPGKLLNSHPIQHNIPAAANKTLSAVTFLLTDEHWLVNWQILSSLIRTRKHTCSKVMFPELGNAPAARRCSSKYNPFFYFQSVLLTSVTRCLRLYTAHIQHRETKGRRDNHHFRKNDTYGKRRP